MDVLKELEKLRRDHRIIDEDDWFSCPKSGRCLNDLDGIECNCGADKHNERLDKIIRYLKQENCFQ